MKNKLLLKSVLLITAASLLGAGCVVREVRYTPPPPGPNGPPPPPDAAEVEVGGPPPPPAAVETVTVAPAPGFFWIGGFWAWDGRWVWRPGHYERPPHPGAVWVGPRYVFRGGHHIWVRGRWR